MTISVSEVGKLSSTTALTAIRVQTKHATMVMNSNVLILKNGSDNGIEAE